MSGACRSFIQCRMSCCSGVSPSSSSNGGGAAGIGTSSSLRGASRSRFWNALSPRSRLVKKLSSSSSSFIMLATRSGGNAFGLVTVAHGGLIKRSGTRAHRRRRRDSIVEVPVRWETRSSSKIVICRSWSTHSMGGTGWRYAVTPNINKNSRYDT